MDFYLLRLINPITPSVVFKPRNRIPKIDFNHGETFDWDFRGTFGVNFRGGFKIFGVMFR